MTTATKKTLADLTDDELLMFGALRGIVATPDDWHPSVEEIRSHDTDKLPVTGANNHQINAELKTRGLKGRTSRPW